MILRPHSSTPKRCVCDVLTDTPRWHGKRRSGSSLSTRDAAKHRSKCLHSDFALTTRRFRPVKIRALPGTRRLIAIEIET